jgi:hypothetical protein
VTRSGRFGSALNTFRFCVSAYSVVEADEKGR